MKRRRGNRGHCPDCGTAPTGAGNACGWPCGLLGLVALAPRNRARETFFRRRGASIWWPR
jgi:hypothetical protein